MVSRIGSKNACLCCEGSRGCPTVRDCLLSHGCTRRYSCATRPFGQGLWRGGKPGGKGGGFLARVSTTRPRLLAEEWVINLPRAQPSKAKRERNSELRHLAQLCVRVHQGRRKGSPHSTARCCVLLVRPRTTGRRIEIKSSYDGLDAR